MTSYVGALQLPVPAGEPNSRLADPTVRGLAAYLAFALRTDLNAKLTALLGMSADACPEANVYWWDPNTTFVRDSFPSLYLWWPGQSRVFQKTHVHSHRERELFGMYIFEETTSPTGRRARSGLLAAVDAVLSKAAERGRDAAHTPLVAGAFHGQSLANALNLANWDFLGSTQSQFLAEVPGASSAPGGPAEGHVKTGYPALLFKLQVEERIGDDVLPSSDVQDADLTMTIESHEQGDLPNAIETLVRYDHAAYGPHDED